MFKPKVTFVKDVLSETNTIMVRWYQRNAQEAIDSAATEALHEGIRKAILEDEGLRAKVQEAISLAVSQLMFEELVKSVKDTVREQMIEPVWKSATGKLYPPRL